MTISQKTIDDVAQNLKDLDRKLNWLIDRIYQDKPVERFIRLKEVERRVGFGRTSIYQMIKEGEFPRPYHHGKKSLWLESEVLAWQNTIIQARRGADTTQSPTY